MNAITETPDQKAHTASELAQHARDYLSGYGRHDLARLQQLARFDAWQPMAQMEIERRACSLLQSFSPELLQAIADGTVRIDQIAGEVAEQIARKSR